MDILRLDASHKDFAVQLDDLLEWDLSEASQVEQTTRSVLQAIKKSGDQALLGYTEQFDKLSVAKVAELELGTATLKAAVKNISTEQHHALHAAAARIRDYHEHQLQASWSFEDALGNQLGQRITPLERVGVYVPGGQASYPSSVLMTLVPAKVAGVKELVVTVPTPAGERNELVLAALAIAGADRVFTVGGAQAIGALAYGTETVPKVDKIVGPGGAYVAAAKRLVFGQVGIDLIAGPSEICVVADGDADPEWIAWDLFSQAEHDAAAQSILVSPDSELILQVARHMTDLLPTLKRANVVAASLSARGALIKVPDMDAAFSVVNRVAPEHLQLNMADPQAWIDKVKHAGAIFCGAHTAEAFGDYVAGPSHVLPTFGTARFASPLGVYDFQKRSSVIELSADGAASLADIAVPLATGEGLEAHARAASIRAHQSTDAS